MNKDAAIAATIVLGFIVLAVGLIVGGAALIIYTFREGGVIALACLGVVLVLALGWWGIYEDIARRGP